MSAKKNKRAASVGGLFDLDFTVSVKLGRGSRAGTLPCIEQVRKQFRLLVNIADPMRTPWDEFTERHTECALAVLCVRALLRQGRRGRGTVHVAGTSGRTGTPPQSGLMSAASAHLRSGGCIAAVETTPQTRRAAATPEPLFAPSAATRADPRRQIRGVERRYVAVPTIVHPASAPARSTRAAGAALGHGLNRRLVIIPKLLLNKINAGSRLCAF
jgi:hypothetical protein